MEGLIILVVLVGGGLFGYVIYQMCEAAREAFLKLEQEYHSALDEFEKSNTSENRKKAIELGEKYYYAKIPDTQTRDGNGQVTATHNNSANRTAAIQLDILKRTHEKSVSAEPQLSVADEISKLTKLKEDGAITEEEYSEMKANVIKNAA